MCKAGSQEYPKPEAPPRTRLSISVEQNQALWRVCDINFAIKWPLAACLSQPQSGKTHKIPPLTIKNPLLLIKCHSPATLNTIPVCFLLQGLSFCFTDITQKTCRANCQLRLREGKNSPWCHFTTFSLEKCSCPF